MKLNLLNCFILVYLFGVPALAINSPNTSANVLFLYRNSNFHKEDIDQTSTNPDQNPNGFNIQEAELQFFSDVDPYTRLSLLLAVHPEYEGTGTNIEEKWVIEPEEAFAESNAVEATMLKIGKFKAFMGKHNQLHTHAYPFIDAPLANVNLLGEEGLNDVGVSAAYLVPTSWFNEFTLQYLRGKGENEEFNSPAPDHGLGLLHWKNLFDLSDALTMELGASYGQGENSFKKNTNLQGVDLTFKWRPVEGGRYHSWTWATEYLGRSKEQTEMPNEKGSGVATWIQYQFAERWAALYRYDNLTIKDSFDPANLPNDTWVRNSVAFNYAPSEFSSFKLEFDSRRGGPVSSTNESTEKTIYLQANFTIGAHPSHSY